MSQQNKPAVRMSTYRRRLSDKILIAFDHACDQGDLPIAEQLAHALEILLKRHPLHMARNRRLQDLETLVAVHERLSALRHSACGVVPE